MTTLAEHTLTTTLTPIVRTTRNVVRIHPLPDMPDLFVGVVDIATADFQTEPSPPARASTPCSHPHLRHHPKPARPEQCLITHARIQEGGRVSIGEDMGEIVREISAWRVTASGERAVHLSPVTTSAGGSLATCDPRNRLRIPEHLLRSAELVAPAPVAVALDRATGAIDIVALDALVAGWLNTDAAAVAA